MASCMQRTLCLIKHSALVLRGRALVEIPQRLMGNTAEQVFCRSERKSKFYSPSQLVTRPLYLISPLATSELDIYDHLAFGMIQIKR